MGYDQLNTLRRKLDKGQGTKDHISKEIERGKELIQKQKEHLINCQKAQLIVQIVAQQTQEKLEYRLNELVTLAMFAIFQEDAYQLKMRFDIKRGRTEASPLFIQDDKERRPMYGTGFGAADVASFALRPTLWSLETPKKSPFFFLDEPFRHLNDPTHTLHKRAATMIKDMSEKLDIQIVIITQNEALCDAGNVVFHIEKKNGKSYIK